MATSPGGCRQTLIPHQAGAFVGKHASRPARVSSAARLDAAARQLRTALLFLSLPLASAARAFHRCRGWKDFGYARLSDHARERLDRSARWVRDLAALSEAAERLPGLAAALTGEDGGRPIGLVAASHIGKVATRESLDAWLSMARTHSCVNSRHGPATQRQPALIGLRWKMTLRSRIHR